MFPAPFEYVPARSMDEAPPLSVARRRCAHPRRRTEPHPGNALPPRRARQGPRRHQSDYRTRVYAEDDGTLRIGAGARDLRSKSRRLIKDRYHLMADAAAVVADPVVRQSGTVVGSLCHNDPAGDWSVVALASRAEIVVRGKGGERVVPIDDFLIDSYTTAVGEGEIALEVRFPTPGPLTSGSYQKIERKVGDFATASAAVQLTLSADGSIANAGIAIGAAGPKALRVAQAERILDRGSALERCAAGSRRSRERTLGPRRRHPRGCGIQA